MRFACQPGCTKCCPGIGQGALMQIEAALEIAVEMPDAYPTLPRF